MRKVAIVTVHGIGMQTADYANNFFKKITKEMNKLDEDIEVQCFACLWKTAVGPVEDELAERIFEEGPKWKLLRDFMIHFVGDALAYQIPSVGGAFKPLVYPRLGVQPDSPRVEAYEDIHQRLDATLSMAQQWLGDDPNGELVIVAHSLGTIVANNFIWDATHPDSDGAKAFGASDEAKAALKKLWLLVTLGSPLALWSLQWENQGHSIAVQNWLNIWCPSDIIAYPIGSINAEDAFDCGYEDVRMYVGGPLTFWNPASHVMYMGSMRVIRMIVDRICFGCDNY